MGHDAAVTVPGMAKQAKDEAGGRESTGVRANAGILGRLFLKWFGNCATKGDETRVLVANAMSYAEQCALEAGLKRCNSRVGVTTTRAGWFVRDAPAPMGNAEWLLYKALSEGMVSAILKVSPFRMAESMPVSDSMRGSMQNQGFAYQYVRRLRALVFLLTYVWLAPTASYSNRVTFAEVATRALEACKMMVNTGLTERWEAERSEHTGSPWAFNAVLDSVAFAIVFGIIVNEPSRDAGMLQIRLAGTAPGVGEYHFASPRQLPVVSASTISSTILRLLPVVRR